MGKNLNECVEVERGKKLILPFIGRVLLCNAHAFYWNKAIFQSFGPQLCKGISKYIEYATTQAGSFFLDFVKLSKACF